MSCFLEKLKTDWANQHLGTINEEDELIPDTNVKVSFVNAGDTDDLCSPSVAGGYLGAENQAIRVQVTNYDAATNSGHFNGALIMQPHSIELLLQQMQMGIQ